jgi:hypothetical protein
MTCCCGVRHVSFELANRCCVVCGVDYAKGLQAFKDYVHKRLDDAGVPTHPENKTHQNEGCRVGDRLDIVLSFYAKHWALKEVAE